MGFAKLKTVDGGGGKPDWFRFSWFTNIYIYTYDSWASWFNIIYPDMNHLKSFRLRTVLFGFYDICSRGVGLEWWRQLEQAVLGCFRKVLKSITGPIYISCVRNMSTFAGVIGGLKPSINEPSCKHSNRNCHVRCLLHETRTFHSDQQERVR